MQNLCGEKDFQAEIYLSRGSQGENDFFRNGLRRFSRKVDITLKKELIIPFVFVFFLLRFANSDPLHTVQ
jgi:hypothetical protein